MSALYITSLQKGEGKTALCIALAKRLQNEGKKVSYLKPLIISDATPSGAVDADTSYLNNLLCIEQSPQSMPIAINSTDLKKALKSSDSPLWKDVSTKFQSASNGKDVVLIEGVNGSSNEMLAASAKLSELLNGKTLLVAKYSTALSLETLQSAVKMFGSSLIGTIINCAPKNRIEALKSSIAAARDGIKLAGVLPEDRLLLSPTVAELSEFLSGKILNSAEKSGELVENFMVGAMSVDSGMTFLSRKNNKAVIMRGDRPDLQLAALNTSTCCLVATTNTKPIDNVLMWAKEKKVPVILVEKKTSAVLDELAGLVNQITIRNDARVSKFAQLVNQNLDLKAILKAL